MSVARRRRKRFHQKLWSSWNSWCEQQKHIKLKLMMKLRWWCQWRTTKESRCGRYELENWKSRTIAKIFGKTRNCIWRLDIVSPPYFDIDSNVFQLDLGWSVSNVGRSTPSSHQTDWKLGVWWGGAVSGNLSLGSLVLLGMGFHDRFHLHGKDRIGVPPSWFGITKGAFLETLSLKLVSLAHWHHWRLTRFRSWFSKGWFSIPMCLLTIMAEWTKEIYEVPVCTSSSNARRVFIQSKLWPSTGHIWGKYSWGISLVNEGFWSAPKTWRPEESYRFPLKPETQGEDQWSTTTQPFLLWLTMHYTSNTMVCPFRSCKARCW